MMRGPKQLILLAVILGLLSGCEKPLEQVVEGKFKREEIGISSKVPGRIISLKVGEGEDVSKGDTLAILDIPEVEAKLKQAEGALLSAKAQYEMAVEGATDDEREQINAVFGAAEEQYRFLEKTKERMQGLYEDSLISAQQYDEILARYNGARAQFEQARAKKNEVKGGVREEKQLMAKGQMERAEGALQEARVAYDERFMIAPVDMDIQTISLKEGELVLPGYTIFSGYRKGTAYVRATVPEGKINGYKKEEEYFITQAFSGEMIKARLVSVNELAAYASITSSYPDYEMGESVYELRLEPESQAEVDSWYANTTVLIGKESEL